MRLIWYECPLGLLRMLEELLMRSFNIDVLDALGHYYVNCHNTDLPLPRRLCLRHRSVCHPFILRTHSDRCPFSAMDSGKAPRIGRNVPTSKLIFAAPTSLRRTEVAMDTSHEQYLTPLTDQDVIYIGRESPEQLHDKPRGLSFDDDPESGAEKCVPE